MKKLIILKVKINKAKTVPIEKKASQLYGYKKMTLRQQKVVKKLWPSYCIARNLDFAAGFNEYVNYIPKKLNEKFKLRVLPELDLLKQRGLAFPPMGMSYNSTKKIEFNCIYEWATMIQWGEIFWHEMGHLLHTYDVHYWVFHKTIINCAKKAHKLVNFKVGKNLRETLLYYTKASNTDGYKDYYNVLNEAFAESFALIMILILFGTQPKVMSCLYGRKEIITIYYPLIEKLINWIDFNAMGIGITERKCQSYKLIFKQIAQKGAKK